MVLANLWRNRPAGVRAAGLAVDRLRDLITALAKGRARGAELDWLELVQLTGRGRLQLELAKHEVAEPFGFEAGTVLRFTLKQPFDDSHTIGKFAISITTHTGPLSLGLPDNVKKVLAIARDKRDDKQKGELSKYFRDNDPNWKKLEQQLAEAKSRCRSIRN